MEPWQHIHLVFQNRKIIFIWGRKLLMLSLGQHLRRHSRFYLPRAGTVLRLHAGTRTQWSQQPKEAQGSWNLLILLLSNELRSDRCAIRAACLPSSSCSVPSAWPVMAACRPGDRLGVCFHINSWAHLQEFVLVRVWWCIYWRGNADIYKMMPSSVLPHVQPPAATASLFFGVVKWRSVNL